MTKGNTEPVKEKEETTPKLKEEGNLPGLPDILGCLKSVAHQVRPKENSEVCELNIVGTPEMILKILKIK